MARLLRMPEVAANAVEAVLSEWPIPENTPFRSTDYIATIETEKAVVDVPAEADGVILKKLVQAGTTIEVGAPIALLGDPGEHVEDLGALLFELGVGSEVAPTTVAPSAAPAASAHPAALSAATTANLTHATSGGAADQTGARIFSSPLARRLAREAGLSIGDIHGSGPGGRIVRRDVEQAARSAPESIPAATSTVTSAVAAAYEDIPHTRMRRAIAARLTESTRDRPHFFLQGTARVDRLLRLRARLNGSDNDSDKGSDKKLGAVSVSVNDLVVTAASRAHVMVPAMNVIWTADAVRFFSAVDISVAVATERGLVTPVLRAVDQMTLSAVAAAGRDLAARARSGQLRQEELEGGTLTVTNLGMFGAEGFAAIINPPQSAILAVGAALEKPVVSKGKLKVGTVMSFTLSVDHRPIDGATAAQWMAAFISLLEEPVRILG